MFSENRMQRDDATMVNVPRPSGSDRKCAIADYVERTYAPWLGQCRMPSPLSEAVFNS